jgi:hypothetical protein
MPPEKKTIPPAPAAPEPADAGKSARTTSSQATVATQGTARSPCGAVGALTFPPLDVALIPNNIRMLADATHIHGLRQAGVAVAGERLLRSFRRGQLDPAPPVGDLICSHCARAPQRVPDEDVEEVMDDLFGDGLIEEQLADLASTAPLHEQALMVTQRTVPTVIRHNMVQAIRSLAQTLSARGGSGPCFVINAEGTRLTELLTIMATPEVSGFVGGTRAGDVLGVVSELSDVPVDEVRTSAFRGAAARSVFIGVWNLAKNGALTLHSDPLAGKVAAGKPPSSSRAAPAAGNPLSASPEPASASPSSRSTAKTTNGPLTDQDLAALHEPLCDWEGTFASRSATLASVRSFGDREAEHGRRRLEMSNPARFGSPFGD